MTTYSDVLGNYISASETMQMFQDSGSDNLADWIEQQSIELWGAEHDPALDWDALAAGLQRSAAAATLGRSTSDAKAAAARTNGRKGGRPRKQQSA